MTIHILSNTHERSGLTGRLVWPACLLVILTGCLANYGAVRPSSQVDQDFVDGRVLPGYNYYYSGPDAIPNAILALKNDYQLQTALWKPVQPTPEQMAQWMDRFTRYRGYTVRTYGAVVLDPQGQEIGMWFSPWERTTVRMLGDNQVEIHTPITRDRRFLHESHISNP